MRLRRRRNYSSSIIFNDLLFNTLLGFVFLFICAYLLIAPVTEKKLSPKAEYIITMTWQNTSKDDVDIWLQDPVGNILFFRQKEKGLMHLDKDDLGTTNDTIVMPDGSTVVVKINQEIVTIRGFIPGEWILNIHLYRKNSVEAANVEIKMDRINPSVKTVILKTITLETYWQEETVARFVMAADGDILSMDDLPKSLVESEYPRGGSPF